MNEHRGTYNIASMRLSHIPTVSTNGKQFAVWTDVKELLLWCADTHCCIVLEALNRLKCNSFVHPCSIQEYQSFSKQYVIVMPGTCLVDVEILENPEIFSFLHQCVRKKHLESKCPETSNCMKMLQVISSKYANTSFKIPLRMASNMKLLPALRRNSLIRNYEGGAETSQSCSVTAENSTQILVPISLLADLYSECTGFLYEAVQLYVQGVHEPGSLHSICQCTVEEGIQLTRFISCYRGYGSSWSCFTSNSLLIAWTEFLNRLDNVTKNKLYPKLSNTGVIILNCESIPKTAGQTNISTKHLVNHSMTNNEGHRYTDVNEGCTDGTGMIKKLNEIQSVVQLVNDSQPSSPSKKNKVHIQNLQLDQQVGEEIHADSKRNKSKTKSVDDNETDKNVMKSKVCRPENKTVEGVVTRNGRKLNSVNHSESQSVQEGSSDKCKKDINNSATKRCIGNMLNKPGSGDNTEMDVKLKNHNRKEILQLSKLTISNTNTGLSKEIKENAGSVKTDNNVKDKHAHIVVPVCDNDTKTDFSMSEVSGYDLSSLVTEEVQQGIHVSITTKRNVGIDEQHKNMSDTHITKRKDEGERKYLKLSTAFINDDMPDPLRFAEKIPVALAVKASVTNEGDVIKSSNLQNCENLDSDEKPKFTSVTPKQLEITTPMLQGIHVDPNKVQENRKFPYKPVRSDHKQPQENPVVQCPNLTPALAANLAVPVIEGTQICVKSAAEKPLVCDKSMFYHAKPILATVTNETSRQSPENQLENVHENNVTQSLTRSGLKCPQNDQSGTPGPFIAAGKVVKTFERTTDFNSTEFMKERITMWRDSVQQALNPNKTGRLTKSADFRRSRQTCTNRPSSSLYCSFSTKFERENQAISSSVCPLAQSSREFNSPESCYNKLCDNTETNNHSEPVKQRHCLEVQNYGSSSSTTPDIYDEFARKRRPKQLKPDTVQIKPKPVTRPIPTTLCQPIVRKTPAQTVAPKPSTPNHNTAGYISSSVTRPIFPKTWLVNKADNVNSGLKQSYHHSNSTTPNNVYHDSKSSEFKGLVSTITNNTNSNTSCSYSACSLNKKEMTRKVPSAKEERKPFVPEFCKFVERPQTAKMSSVLYSNSSLNDKFGQQESELKSSNFDNMVNNPHDEMTRIEKTTEECDIGGTITGYTEGKKSLLDKMTSFVNSYVSPKNTESLEDINSIHSILSTNPLQGMSLGEFERDFVKESFDNKCKPKIHCESLASVPDFEHYKYSSLDECESAGQVLSKVDSQLYYKVPDESRYHRVTGNMVIPPNAQFFIQSRGTSETTLSVDSSEMITSEDNTEDINPAMNKYVNSLDANSDSVSPQRLCDSSHSILQNSDTGTKDNMGKESDKNSVFDKILMTSNNFIDKVEQMKHIIHETQQAIQRVNEPDDEDGLTDVRKVNSDENDPSSNQEEIDHGRNDPVKVISPSHGLELTKKTTSNKKKSFKEVVEEKREQRKRTEKELSKKKFWNSAHSKMEKTEPKTKEAGKDKPKPVQKEKIGISRITSGGLKSKQNAVSFKSGNNQQCGRKVDNVIKTKKGATTGQRLKTTETKLTAKESHVKHNPNEIGSTANRSKSTHSTKRNNQVRSTINSNDQKQRVSKSAGQFPKTRGTGINQKDGCTDDCTNKILTALRRLSIEKPSKKDVYISPKLDARQRKLRSCVVKKLIGPKYCSDNKSNLVKGTYKCSDKHDKLDEKSASEDLEPIDLLENNESSTCEKTSTHDKEQTHSDNFTKECYVSLRKLCDSKIRKQDSNKIKEDIPCNEVSSYVEKTNPSSKIIDYVNDDQTVNEENIEEKTFITKFKINGENEKTEFGDSLIVDERSDDPFMTLNENDELLNDVNVNCKANEASKAEESVRMDQNVNNPVYHNASKEQYVLLGTDLMHSDKKADIDIDAFCENGTETPNTTETTNDDYKVTSRTEDTTNEYAVDNVIEDGKAENDDNEPGEETFLYSEADVDSTDGLQNQLFWIEKEHFADDVATSHVELICLDNQYYHGETNGVNVIDNDPDENEIDQELKDGHFSDNYLGLQIACSGLEQIDTSATKTINNTENDRIYFFDETECGEEVYIETDDTNVQSVPSVEDNSKILHDDVFMNGNGDDEKLKLDTDIIKYSAEVSKDRPDVGKPGKNKKKQKGNSTCLDVRDKEKCETKLSTAQFIGDPSLYSDKISPSQSEMEAYFEKVAERAGLNPFSDFCQNGTSDTDVLESEAHTNDELHSKDIQSDVNKDKEREADDDASFSDHSDDDLHAFDGKSDDADKDYNPDIDSYSDSDIENNIGASKNIKSVVKTKSKKKRKIVKSEDKHKVVNVKKVLSEEEIWKKYLKDSYACDKKTRKDKKASKPRRPEDGNEQSELESSIVREYCLRHAESEETLAQLKTKLWKKKYLTKETESTTLGNIEADRKNVKSDPAKKLRKKSKSKHSRKSKAVNDNDSDDEKKERDEAKAAEGFIKTQKLYFNILRKSSIGQSKPDYEDAEDISNTNIKDLPEVLEAVAVHGERSISKAESDAEKALEGTGSLDNMLAEDEGTIIVDLANQCRYQLIEDEDHVQLGGIAYFKDFQLPFVYNNGYKYTPVKDVVRLFQTRSCSTKCTIPRKVLQKYKTLVKSFSTWEQVYKLELIKLQKGPTVITGDMLVKLDSLLSLLPEIINTIRQQHKGTKLKNSQSCSMDGYKRLLSSLV